MKRPAFDIRIGAITLSGFAACRPEDVRTGCRDELRRLFEREDVLAFQPRSVVNAPAVRVTASMDGRAIGIQLARAIFRGLKP